MLHLRHSIPMEPPLQPSELAQLCAPTSTLIPPSIPIAQDPVSSSDPPLHTISQTFAPPLLT